MSDIKDPFVSLINHIVEDVAVVKAQTHDAMKSPTCSTDDKKYLSQMWHLLDDYQDKLRKISIQKLRDETQAIRATGNKA